MAYESVFADVGAGPVSATASESAGYGPGPSSTTSGMGSPFHPLNGFGAAFWLGVAGIAALVVIRHSLPA